MTLSKMFKKYLEDIVNKLPKDYDPKESFLYKKQCEIQDRLDKMRSGKLPKPTQETDD